MSYLMIDLDKAVMPLHEVSLEAGAVYLFAKRKRNRHLAKIFAKQHRAVRVVCVKEDEKLANVLTKQVKKILKKDETAGIVVMSRREKVARGMNKLLNHYPDAEMIVIEKKLKKQKSTQALENDIDSPIESEPETVIAQASPPKQLAKPAAVPLLAPPKRKQPATASGEKVPDEPMEMVAVDDNLVQNALNVLNKNRPRQRDALMRLLTHHLNLKGKNITPLLDELEKIGAVKMSEQGTMKYTV